MKEIWAYGKKLENLLASWECHDKSGTGEHYELPVHVLWKWKGISLIHFLQDQKWNFEEMVLLKYIERGV